MLELTHVVKYVLEGLAVAFVAYYLTGKKTDLFEIAMLGLTASLTFLVLDLFAPSVALGSRQGAGFGVGYGMVGGDADQDTVAEDFKDNQEGGNPTGRPWEWFKFNPTAAKQSGGGPTGRPWEWYNPFSSRTALKEGFESQEQHDEAAKDIGKPYKLKDGQYAAKIVQPGYNEEVRPYNTYGCQFVSDPSVWNQDLFDAYDAKGHNQTGGADPSSAPTTGAPVAPPTQALPAPPGAPTTQPAPGEKKNDKFAVDDPEFRRAGVLYSGDLVVLTTNGNYIQRGAVDSQIVFDKPLPKMGTNLSKLRIVHANKHSLTKQVPINYGDPVNIMHNAYFNNKNEPRYVKYGERLQSHQEGPLFRVFKIVDPANPTRTGPVEPGQDILLMRGDVEGKNIYLKVEDDKTVSSIAEQTNAAKFQIELVRVYELHNKNLCVCPNEVLYP